MLPDATQPTPPAARRRVGVLISGRGNNLQAIIEASAAGELDAVIALVISNIAEAGGLSHARRAGVPTQCSITATSRPGRPSTRRSWRPCGPTRSTSSASRGSCACSARTSSRRSPTPSSTSTRRCCRAFPGLHAERQALTHGAKVSGARRYTSSTANSTRGPIVLQAAVPVRDDDSEDSLSARVLIEEHRIYSEGDWSRAEGRLACRGPPVPGGHIGVGRGLRSSHSIWEGHGCRCE